METPVETKSLTIRPAGQDDLDTMVVLLQALFTTEKDFTPDPERQRQGLARFLAGCGKHRCILVAEADKRVVAMATVQVLISTAQGGLVGLVEDVVVQEGFRGRGVGRRLVNALVDWAADRGLTRLQLLADDRNRPVLDFYRKMGWHTTQLLCLRYLSIAS